MDITDDDLPQILVEIARAIGLPDTLKFAERFGGALLYFPRPKTLTIEHPIVQVVGLDAARKISAIFTCRRLKIPRASRVLSLIRNASIHADSQSLSTNQLVRKYGLDERSIWRILATFRDQPGRPAPSRGIVRGVRTG